MSDVIVGRDAVHDLSRLLVSSGSYLGLMATVATLVALLGATGKLNWRRAFALALALLTIGFLRYASITDDSYIYYRYADSILQGLGPVYNPGERVEGFTSPLWLAACVVLQGVGLGPALAGVILGYAAALALLLAFWYAMIPLATPMPARIVLFLLVAALPESTKWSASGMGDVTLAAATLVFGLGLYLRTVLWSSPALSWSVAVLSAGVLVRPEIAGAAVIIVVAEAASKEHRYRELRGLAAPAACMVGILAFVTVIRWLYYGDIFPNTFRAKSLPLTAIVLERGVFSASLMIVSSPTAVLAVVALIVGVMNGIWLRRKVLCVCSAIGLLFVGVVVRVGGDHFPHRFLVLIVPLGLLSAAMLWEHWTTGPGLRSQVALAAVLGCLMLSGAVLAPRPWPAATDHGRVGRLLDAKLPRDSLIAVEAAGAMPYFARRTTIDMLGLCDRNISRALPTEGALKYGEPGHQKSDPSYVVSRRPDYVFPWFRGGGYLVAYDAVGLTIGELSMQLGHENSRRLTALPEFKAHYVLDSVRVAFGSRQGHVNYFRLQGRPAIK